MRTGFLAFGLLVSLIAAQPAHALQSCSHYKEVCMVRAVNKSLCDGAWKKCMRTSIYIGPESGTNHGQAEKK